MTTTPAPSIFETINAKALKPTQVAQTFVPPAQFDELVKRRNTVIVGPRGSGKTTMLKMLQQPALESWNHPRADEFRSRIDYSTAFISTDVSWGAQVRALGEGKLDEETHRRLGIAAFTTHVLRALVQAFLYRVGSEGVSVQQAFRRIRLSAENERELVLEIASSWELTPTIPSLLSLRQALSKRLVGIRTLASQEATLGPSGRPARIAALSYLHLHFLQSASLGVEIFNDSVNQHDEKWALLFDELELAPDWIREELVRHLRGSDDRFLLKLALSPFEREIGEFESAHGAAPGHDYDQIPLWYAHKQDGYPFCEKLWYGMLREKEMPEVSPGELLGRSYFETTPDEWRRTGTAYGPNSRWGKLFIRMAKEDPSFRRYLRKKGIDPFQLHRLEGGERAAEIRKIAPVLAVRDYFRSYEDSSTPSARTRSRKQRTLYSGADALFAITEGNPRWFLGLIDALLTNRESVTAPIPPTVQAGQLIQAAQRFSALLRTIPLPEGTADRHDRGLLTIINQIGDFIHDQVVNEDFTPEPPGTFIVDSNTSEAMLYLLGRALNAGALVYVPDDKAQVILTSLRGKRFRLSYLLSPLHKTPLRLGRGVALSKILSRRIAEPVETQLELRSDR